MRKDDTADAAYSLVVLRYFLNIAKVVNNTGKDPRIKLLSHHNNLDFNYERGGTVGQNEVIVIDKKFACE